MADRLYHFRFAGIQEPITIKAPSSAHARAVLQSSALPAPYDLEKITGETTSALIVGVSHLVVNGKKLVWDGQTFK